jgi:Mor family transcriptional regulator
MNVPRMAQADLRRVQHAAVKAAEARAELRQAILTARASGETLADIAKAAKLSRQRIAQIVKKPD